MSDDGRARRTVSIDVDGVEAAARPKELSHSRCEALPDAFHLRRIHVNGVSFAAGGPGPTRGVEDVCCGRRGRVRRLWGFLIWERSKGHDDLVNASRRSRRFVRWRVRRHICGRVFLVIKWSRMRIMRRRRRTVKIVFRA